MSRQSKTMNIAFYTAFEVSPQKGGTERITCSIAKGLKEYYNVNCYSIYSESINSVFKRYDFVDVFHLYNSKSSYSNLKLFFEYNKIDILVIQGAFSLIKPFREILPKHIKIIFCHHFAPGWEENFFTLRSTFNLINKKRDTSKQLFKLLFYPFLKYKKNRCLHQMYNEAYQYADKIVLLSEKFKYDFMSYGNITDDSKFIAIHNALSFDNFFDISQYYKKQKEVLIVSRLEESQKRIYYALKIWRKIERINILKDWKLIIIGHGEDENLYKAYVKRHKLQRVSFEGIQQPEPYYQRASLFMLTSKSEGWGLTLTEAQQFGCVPLAFNSYASLSDIIIDNKNGFIIPYPQIDVYVNTLKEIMINDKMRQKIAAQAIEDSKRFKLKSICNDWYKLFLEQIKQ